MTVTSILSLTKCCRSLRRSGWRTISTSFANRAFSRWRKPRRIVRAGLAQGLRPKIHANQLHLSGGVETGVRLGAVSVDHLETMDAAAIAVLADSDTIGTLLPTAAFFLRMPFQPSRELIDAGCAIALASDYNPGSSPSGNMNLVVSMAVSKCGCCRKKRSTRRPSTEPMPCRWAMNWAASPPGSGQTSLLRG